MYRTTVGVLLLCLGGFVFSNWAGELSARTLTLHPCQYGQNLLCIHPQDLQIQRREEARRQHVLNDHKRLPRHRMRVHPSDKVPTIQTQRWHEHERYSLAGFPQPLIEKVREIESGCRGFHIISAFRPHAKVRGSGRTSLHAKRKAIDIAGPNYQCAYEHLRHFPGGYSLDPYAVHHIHLSWAPGSSEWGARFYHWGHGPRAAHRHHHRFAIRAKRRVG